jgi:PadR family transcriptional regulator, regulatory protein PadR
MVVRLTIPTRLVLEAFLADPDTEQYGLELARSAGLPTGTVHPILARMEGVGWLDSHWEDVDPSEAGRPARRYYRLTTTGLREGSARAARSPRPRLAARAIGVQP